MNRASSAGFTIIETMLVLSISGVLTIGLLAGAGISISQQRYRESVLSVQTFVQEGYNFTTITENGRNGAQICDDGDVSEVGTPADGDARGTTDCLMVGRFITIQGSAMRNASVVAYPTTSTSELEDEQGLTERYNFRVVGYDAIEKTVPWESIVAEPGSPAAAAFSVLVLRSPLTNGIVTYSTPQAVADEQLATMITADNRRYEQLLCIETDAWFAGSTQAVRIQPNATGPGFVDIPDESENVCA